jgi:histidinol-phosphate aminotransferase
VPIPRAAAVAREMRERGVAVRAFEALPGVGDALRITAGPAPMMERALAALEEALACA